MGLFFSSLKMMRRSRRRRKRSNTILFEFIRDPLRTGKGKSLIVGACLLRGLLSSRSTPFCHEQKEKTPVGNQSVNSPDDWLALHPPTRQDGSVQVYVCRYCANKPYPAFALISQLCFGPPSSRILFASLTLLQPSNHPTIQPSSRPSIFSTGRPPSPPPRTDIEAIKRGYPIE